MAGINTFGDGKFLNLAADKVLADKEESPKKRFLLKIPYTHLNKKSTTQKLVGKYCVPVEDLVNLDLVYKWLWSMP